MSCGIPEERNENQPCPRCAWAQPPLSRLQFRLQSPQALEFVTQSMFPHSQISKEIFPANRRPAPRRSRLWVKMKHIPMRLRAHREHHRPPRHYTAHGLLWQATHTCSLKHDFGCGSGRATRRSGSAPGVHILENPDMVQGLVISAPGRWRPADP